jgi:2-methylcitrate dehydratase PrpD
MFNPTVDFIHTVAWSDIPAPAQMMARQCLLDLLGVAASGTQTQLSQLINNHAIEHFAKSDNSLGSGLLFDGRLCSPLGAAMANGMTIDAIDAHDGYKPSKGHAGCGVLAALLAFVGNEVDPNAFTEEELLTCLVKSPAVQAWPYMTAHRTITPPVPGLRWRPLPLARV